MRKLLLIGVVGLLSLNSFASYEKPNESFYYPMVNVYCDGEYAGSFYNLPSYSTWDLIDMATSMCD
nr:hypothetical protein [Allomuricauda sp.]